MSNQADQVLSLALKALATIALFACGFWFRQMSHDLRDIRALVGDHNVKFAEIETRQQSLIDEMERIRDLIRQQ